jgi:NhaP-type Na+/H+ or K+/H+ antiporter
MTDLSGYHGALAAFGAVILLAYWLPRLVSGRKPAASALLLGLGCLAFGFLPGVPSVIDPVALPLAWELASELCVIIGLFGSGLRIDRLGVRGQWRATLGLLAIAMPACIAGVWLAGVQLAALSPAAALLLAAVLAPTDPVLAGDLQVGPPQEGGEHPVRFTLTTEAGLNDGLAFPFVHLSLALAAEGGFGADLVAQWLWRDLALKIAVGTLAGAGIGALLGQLMFAWPRATALADSGSGVIALAGVLMTYGLAELAGGYGFIAAFVSGLVVRRTEARHEFHATLHDFSESIEHTLTAALLVALGAAMPALLGALSWPGAAVAMLLLFVLRPAAAWLSLAGALPRRRERAVVAFYGIRGVGSIYYLAYATGRVDFPDAGSLWAIVGFTILLSTVVHGFTAGIAVERATGGASAGAVSDRS